MTKIVNAVAASAVLPEFAALIKSHGDKIRGVRQSPEVPPPPEGEPIADETVETISASQMDRASRLNNFDEMLQLLIDEPGYVPAEVELTNAALTAYLTDLQTLNTAINSEYPAVYAKMTDKNESLYRTGTGSVETAGILKKYAKSLYGASSPDFKVVSKIKFTMRKI